MTIKRKLKFLNLGESRKPLSCEGWKSHHHKYESRLPWLWILRKTITQFCYVRVK